VGFGRKVSLLDYGKFGSFPLDFRWREGYLNGGFIKGEEFRESGGDKVRKVPSVRGGIPRIKRGGG